MTKKEAIALWEETTSSLSQAGYNVVGVISHYTEEDAHFSSALRLNETESAGADHIVLDAIREISVEWSNLRHKAQLTWTDQ